MVEEKKKQEEKEPKEQKLKEERPKEQKPKEQKPKEEKPKEEKPKAPVEEKKEAGEKKKKINRLSLKELEKKIEYTKEKMGGLTSAYARQLLKRKEQLLQSAKGKEEDKKESKEG